MLPGGVLPGGFEIGARKTYGHLSAGMICSARELGLGEDHDGIIVLPPDAGEPGQDVRAVLGLDEEVIEFEVNPDRAYALSLRGIAREVLVSVEGASGFRDPALRDTPAANDEGHPVVVEDAEGCPVFVARRVDGFDPAAPTPDFMVQRITAAGMRPISLAVDVTNYVMLETGRPIHGYDADRLQGAIVVRRAREGEKLTTLDGTARTLDPGDLVVTDDSGIIGLGGVMGGETTEISGTTTSVLVEAAHWDAVSMFRTGRRHKITSEAGKRNERGVDPTICEAAADRVVELLVEHGGGTAHPGVTVVGTPPAMPVVEVAGDLAARVSGMPITEEQSGRVPARGRLRGLCDRGRLRHVVGHPAPVAPRPHRRPGLLRGGRPARRLRQGAVGPPDASVGSRPHPPAAAAAPDRAHARRRGLRRGRHLPVRRRGRPRRARA